MLDRAIPLLELAQRRGASAKRWRLTSHAAWLLTAACGAAALFGSEEALQTGGALVWVFGITAVLLRSRARYVMTLGATAWDQAQRMLATPEFAAEATALATVKNDSTWLSMHTTAIDYLRQRT